MHGCDEVLPIWNEEPILVEPYEIDMPNGQHVRQLYLITLMTTLEEVMLENDKDDITSLQILCQVHLFFLFIVCSFH